MTEPPTSPLNRMIGGWPAWKWAVTAVVALVAAVAASVMVSRLASKDSGTVTTGATGQPTPTATGPSVTPSITVCCAPTAPQSPPPGRTTATTQATTAPAGPQIVTFRVKTAPSCPAGTNLNPIDGTPVTLEWEVAGADSTVLAVDGPGKYDDFKVKDSVTLSFGCSGPPNTDQKHTFTLTTVGGGPVATKTLTVTAKVNEIAIVSTP